MRVLEGEQVLARIFFGENDRWHGAPLSDVLLRRLREAGFAGATVFRGIAGFGARSVLHTTHLLDLSADLPIVVEVVDSDQQMKKLQPILDDLVTGGCLVTFEKVRIARYAAGRVGEEKKIKN